MICLCGSVCGGVGVMMGGMPGVPVNVTGLEWGSGVLWYADPRDSEPVALYGVQTGVGGFFVLQAYRSGGAWSVDSYPIGSRLPEGVFRAVGGREVADVGEVEGWLRSDFGTFVERVCALRLENGWDRG